MRPIIRGDVPKNTQGEDKIYRNYGSARRDLIGRIGQYCCYCNMRLESGLAIEHVRPKKPVPELETTWSNFLLACTNCNSTKGDEDVDLEDFPVSYTHLTLPTKRIV